MWAHAAANDGVNAQCASVTCDPPGANATRQRRTAHEAVDDRVDGAVEVAEEMRGQRQVRRPLLQVFQNARVPATTVPAGNHG